MRAQSQPQAPQQPQQPQAQQPQQPVRHRVHHSYIWLGSAQMVLALLAALLVAGFSSIIGAIADGARAFADAPAGIMVTVVSVLGFLALVGVVVLVQWWSYRHLYYELGPEEFNLYSGIFNKKRVHVPYQRIQSVDQRATLPQRIFGVCTVDIDTAGGAANKAVQVPYVLRSQAEELRRELFARKQAAAVAQGGAAVARAPQVTASAPGNVLDAPAEIWQDVCEVFGGKEVDTGTVTYEYGLTNRELVLTGLSNHTSQVVIVLGILGVVAQVFELAAPLAAGPLESAFGRVSSAGLQLFGGNLIALVAIAVVAFSVVLWALSAVGACISYGGFKARRRDSRIEVEHGLLQHRFQGVDVDRVQSVMVKQSFIRRLMGYCEVSLGKVDAASENSGGQAQGFEMQTGLVIHPFVKMNRVPEILAGLVPEFADVPVQVTPVAPAALRRALVRRCILLGSGFWLAALAAVTQVAVNLWVAPHYSEQAGVAGTVNLIATACYVLALVLLVFDAAGAVLWYRGSGFAYNERFMQVSNGGLSRETVSFPRRKIQFGYTKTNPFQRRSGTATINVRTAAGVSGSTIRLVDAREDDAQDWLDWMRPRRDATQ
ncbi:PH domain-containing protein [Rubneribacter sp.]